MLYQPIIYSEGASVYLFRVRFALLLCEMLTDIESVMDCQERIG